MIFYSRQGFARSLLLFTLVFIKPALAQNSQPIHVTNTLPIMIGSGLSAPKISDITSQKSLSVDFFSRVESNANDAGSATETLTIDGEVQSFSALGKWNFFPRWQLSIELSALRHAAGNLDNLIREWHDFFGLDQGDRDFLPDGQFLYQYENTDSELSAISINDSVSGISDTELSLAYQLYSDDKINLATYISAVLPSGDANKLTGSDKTDFKFSLALGSRAQRIGWHASGDFIRIGDRRLFTIPTKDTTWATSMGVHFKASNAWRWSAQLDGHGAIFESAIDEIGGSAWQLSLATEYRGWQMYFSEDVSVNHAADFSFGINWRAAY